MLIKNALIMTDKPTDKEIFEETKRLIKGNNFELDKDKWDTNPKLKVGDKVNIAA